MIRIIYTSFVTFLDKLIWIVDLGPSVHKIFLAPQIGNFREMLGKVRAARLYRYSLKHVPAYKDYLTKFPNVKGPTVKLTRTSLNDVPEMDKSSYIKQYGLTDKIIDGKLPKTGVMFDESSGSSGTPTSWVRGRKERRFTQRIMQVAFKHLLVGKSPIVINTFSMGAWATGLNTTLGLLGVSRVKSVGPDITKVINTLNELGSSYDYVITGYPPFLRQITESKELDWEKYKIVAIFGGEGISESMRAELLKYYSQVIGSYGASDLEINIAHESDFTIALRQALTKDENLRKEIIRENRGVIPSVFQYNPYDYLIETNDKGEMLVTICRTENLSPRIRYNIHDLGHAESFYKLSKRLKKLGREDILGLAELDFAVLFHYGRSDLSVDYNGAVVGPEEIKQIINSQEKYDKKIKGFRLISYEDRDSHKHLMFAIELIEKESMSQVEGQELLEEIINKLLEMNLDFKSAHSTSPIKPEIRIYKSEDRIFSKSHQKLKSDYVWNIDYKIASEEGIC